MAGSLQTFLAQATQKAADDLKAAVLRVPEDKREWSPLDKARTALDQAAECAILTGSTADLIAARVWSMGSDFSEFLKQKAELARDWDAIQTLLQQNTERVIEAIRAVPEEDLENIIDMPWGPMTLANIMAYPYWNMSYHEGQVNYIASMLGCL